MRIFTDDIEEAEAQEKAKTKVIDSFQHSDKPSKDYSDAINLLDTRYFSKDRDLGYSKSYTSSTNQASRGSRISAGQNTAQTGYDTDPEDETQVTAPSGLYDGNHASSYRNQEDDDLDDDTEGWIFQDVSDRQDESDFYKGSGTKRQPSQKRPASSGKRPRSSSSGGGNHGKSKKKDRTAAAALTAAALVVIAITVFIFVFASSSGSSASSDTSSVTSSEAGLITPKGVTTPTPTTSSRRAATATPTPTAAATATPTPTAAATATPTPTAAPTEEPEVTTAPTVEPTEEPTEEPTATPTPTEEPAEEPDSTANVGEHESNAGSSNGSSSSSVPAATS